MGDFKVGDKVRIRSWESMKSEFGGKSGLVPTYAPFIDLMKPLCGRTAVISSINGKKVTLKNWSNTDGDVCWDYSIDMLEPAQV